MRGNRRLNHVIHMAAVTQIAHKHSDGHAYYQRKLAEGKTPAEARRALKRKISNAIYARLQADARARAAGPGGQPGNDSASSAAGSHPERQLFGQATPRPAATLRPPARPSRKKSPAGYAERLDRHGNEWNSLCAFQVRFGSSRPPTL